MADELRAIVCSRVVTMLSPAEGEAVAARLAAPPIVHRTLIREKALSPASACGMVVIGAVLAALLMGQLSHVGGTPPGR